MTRSRRRRMRALTMEMTEWNVVIEVVLSCFSDPLSEFDRSNQVLLRSCDLRAAGYAKLVCVSREMIMARTRSEQCWATKFNACSRRGSEPE